MRDEVKVLVLLTSIMSLFAVSFFWQATEHPVMSTSEDLRLRVVANSNEKEDQLVKRMVALALENLLVNQGEWTPMSLKEAAYAVLADVAIEQAVEVSVGYHYFLSDGGYFPSIVVRLGAGQGENWWCFVNPGVCRRPDDEVNVNETQVAAAVEVREVVEVTPRHWLSRIFERVDRRVEASEIDWFLFDDER